MTPDSLTRRQRRELRWWAAELGKDQQGSVPCVSCHGVGLQALENDRDAAVIKNGVGYAAEPCRRCAGMRFFRR